MSVRHCEADEKPAIPEKKHDTIVKKPAIPEKSKRADTKAMKKSKPAEKMATNAQRTKALRNDETLQEYFERLKPSKKDDPCTMICKMQLAKLRWEQLERLTANLIAIGTLTFATMCSGSETPVFALWVLYSILFPLTDQQPPEASFKVLYGCESEKSKIPFGHFMVEKFSRPPTEAYAERESAGGDDSSHNQNWCCYKDVTTLHKGMAECWVHEPKKKRGKAPKSKAIADATKSAYQLATNASTDCEPHMCTVCSGTEGPQLSSIGWSCKNLSKMFTPPDHQRGKKDWLLTGDGSSGVTYWGLKDHLRSNRPAVVHIENVEELLNETNKQIVKADMTSLGYYFTAKLLKALRFGVPQTRNRAHGLLIDTLAVPYDEDGLEELSNEMWDILAQIELSDHIPLAKFLLPCEDSYLVKLLEDYKKRSVGNDLDENDPVWRRGLNDWLKARGETWDACQPSAELLASEWFCLLPPRERLTLAALMNAAPAKVGHNVSQQAFRTDNDGDDMATALGSFCTKSKWYLVEYHRLLAGIEALHIQGIPMHALREALTRRVLCETGAKDFAGNSYTAAVMTAFDIALFITWPFPKMAFHQVPVTRNMDRFFNFPKVRKVETGSSADDLSDAQALQFQRELRKPR